MFNACFELIIHNLMVGFSGIGKYRL